MGSLVAIDSMIFIYLFEQDSRYLKIVKPLFDQIESGKSQAITSIISPLEVLSSPKLINQPEKLQFFTQFFLSTPHLLVIPTSWEISLEAARLRRENKSIKTPDAIQIATAIVHQANVFITNDSFLTTIDLPLKIISVESQNSRLAN